MDRKASNAKYYASRKSKKNEEMLIQEYTEMSKYNTELIELQHKYEMNELKYKNELLELQHKYENELLEMKIQHKDEIISILKEKSIDLEKFHFNQRLNMCR